MYTRTNKMDSVVTKIPTAFVFFLNLYFHQPNRSSKIVGERERDKQANRRGKWVGTMFIWENAKPQNK